MTEVQTSSNSNGVGRAVTVARHDDQIEGPAAMDASGAQQDSQSPPASTIQSSTGRSPKKRRKVNHGERNKRPHVLRRHHLTWDISRLTQGRVIACVYCRRSHMTCNDGMFASFSCVMLVGGVKGRVGSLWGGGQRLYVVLAEVVGLSPHLQI